MISMPLRTSHQPTAESRLYQDTTDQYIRPQLWSKLSGEPFPEYLRPPESSGGKVAECFWLQTNQNLFPAIDPKFTCLNGALP